jgi:hypothetical protein
MILASAVSDFLIGAKLPLAVAMILVGPGKCDPRSREPCFWVVLEGVCLLAHPRFSLVLASAAGDRRRSESCVFVAVPASVTSSGESQWLPQCGQPLPGTSFPTAFQPLVFRDGILGAVWVGIQMRHGVVGLRVEK